MTLIPFCSHFTAYLDGGLLRKVHWGDIFLTVKFWGSSESSLTKYNNLLTTTIYNDSFWVIMKGYFCEGLPNSLFSVRLTDCLNFDFAQFYKKRI